MKILSSFVVLSLLFLGATATKSEEATPPKVYHLEGHCQGSIQIAEKTIACNNDNFSMVVTFYPDESIVFKLYTKERTDSALLGFITKLSTTKPSILTFDTQDIGVGTADKEHPLVLDAKVGKCISVFDDVTKAVTAIACASTDNQDKIYSFMFVSDKKSAPPSNGNRHTEEKPPVRSFDI